MQLGFLEFEVSDPGAWHGFLVDQLGLVGEGRYRLDDRAWRIGVVEGPGDDLATVGWELDPEDLDRAAATLRRLGVPFEEADPVPRSVERRLRLVDPGGVPTELVCGMARAVPPETPLVPSGFVAGELGLGHAVLTAPDVAASARFYAEVLGARLSDRIVCEVYGYPVDLSFFHLNARHHSVALGGRQRKRLHHFMLEVGRIDDVGLCLDRCLRAGVRLTQTLGRHPNDRMVSFYARTPSGFEFEIGCGGRLVDDAAWQPTTYHQISEWGHHPPAILAGRRP